MPTLNTDVQALLQTLLVQHAALLAQLNTATDPKLARATLGEAQELLHRINITQNLLFVAINPELATAITAVKTSEAALKKELKAIVDTKLFINRVSNFLAYVDKAIDIAKTVALL